MQNIRTLSSMIQMTYDLNINTKDLVTEISYVFNLINISRGLNENI